MGNKLTDNEIKKALECCSVKTNCNGCPQLGKKQCLEEALENTLDLINRLEAEIDDLKRDDLPRCKDALRRANENGMALVKENQELKAEVERLTADLKIAENVIKNTFLEKAGLDIDPLVEIKAEAVKEFAERLKEKTSYAKDVFDYTVKLVVDVEEIDNLVKEMVGEE